MTTLNTLRYSRSTPNLLYFTSTFCTFITIKKKKIIHAIYNSCKIFCFNLTQVSKVFNSFTYQLKHERQESTVYQNFSCSYKMLKSDQNSAALALWHWEIPLLTWCKAVKLFAETTVFASFTFVSEVSRF